MRDQFDYFNKDMPEWLQYMRRLALSHASLWGTATLLYAFAMSGILPSLACFWIAHVISNLEWVIYGYGTYLLVAASVSWDYVFGYLMLALIFWGLSWFTFGMGAINFLDPDYPYTDANLIPSIFYLFIDHERPLEFDYDWADLETAEDSEIKSEASAELELDEKVQDQDNESNDTGKDVKDKEEDIQEDSADVEEEGEEEFDDDFEGSEDDFDFGDDFDDFGGIDDDDDFNIF